MEADEEEEVEHMVKVEAAAAEAVIAAGDWVALTMPAETMLVVGRG